MVGRPLNLKDAEVRRAYSRGYSTRAEQWPLHKPAVPPDPIIGELVAALRELRDTADSELATFDEDDELVKALDGSIDRATNALSAVSIWLRERD